MLSLSATKACTKARLLRVMSNPIDAEEKKVTGHWGESVYRPVEFKNLGDSFEVDGYEIKKMDNFLMDLTTYVWNQLYAQTMAEKDDVIKIKGEKIEGKVSWVMAKVDVPKKPTPRDADPFPTDEEGKTATPQKDYSTAEDDKWDKINAKRRREIAWGQAFNLAFNHTVVSEGDDVHIPMDDIIKNAEMIFPELLRDDEELVKLVEGDAVPF